MNLAEQIIKIRTDNNLTQDQFAESLFVTRQAVSKWERAISIPDVEVLKNISIKYRISLNVLLGTLEASKNDKKKALAYKSFFYPLLELLGCIGCSFIGVYMLTQAKYSNDDGIKYNGQSMPSSHSNIDNTILYGVGILFLVLAVIAFLLSFFVLIKPLVMISYNDYGIFIKRKKRLFIPYEDITECKAKQAHSPRMNYSFGKIYIYTKKKCYKVGTIRNVDDIKGEIIYQKTKNTVSEIN